MKRCNNRPKSRYNKSFYTHSVNIEAAPNLDFWKYMNPWMVYLSDN